MRRWKSGRCGLSGRQILLSLIVVFAVVAVMKYRLAPYDGGASREATLRPIQKAALRPIQKATLRPIQKAALRQSDSESYNLRPIQKATLRPIPELSLKYSRLGSQLQLNYTKMCPRGSLMLENSKQRSQFVPNHQNCPSLFIVGARKGGTSSLYTYMSKHPSFKGVLLDKGPAVGETCYFSFFWKQWQWSQYMNMFQNTSHYMTGESSVDYLADCHIPERLWRSCGKQAKIVILLRDPIKTFQSNYLMRARLKTSKIRGNVSTVVNVEMNRFLGAIYP